MKRHRVTMTQVDTSKDEHPPEILDTTLAAGVWPDEDQDELDALRGAFHLDLNPGNAYERSLVEQIVTMEWEMHRWRRLRDSLLHTATKSVALAELAAPTWALPDEDAPHQIAQDFVGDDVDDWEQAVKSLASIGLKPTEIVVSAYAEHAEEIQHFDTKIADLERRKRRLREDFDRLQQARRVREKQITDAETVE